MNTVKENQVYNVRDKSWYISSKYKLNSLCCSRRIITHPACISYICTIVKTSLKWTPSGPQKVYALWNLETFRDIAIIKLGPKNYNIEQKTSIVSVNA